MQYLFVYGLKLSPASFPLVLVEVNTIKLETEVLIK